MLLEVSGLKASVKAGGSRKEILSGVDFSIDRGETVVLLGRNGAGKSTVAAALMGDPKFKVSGSAKFLGKNLLKMSPDKRVNLGLLLTFQSPVEIPGVSTTEILRASLEKKRGKFVPVDEVREKLTENSSENVWFFEREANVGFSGGEKKKNEIALALALEPKLLILDEIDSGLDLDASEEISKLLAEYQKKSGCSYLIISHNLRILRHLEVDRTILLEKGNVYKVGDEKLVKQAEKQGIRAILSEISSERRTL